MLAAETQTIADLVREAPLRANVFERYQIDYCCNGKRPLEDVCAERGLDAAALLAELDTAPDQQDGLDAESMSLSELSDHIVARHHEYLRSTLPSIAMKAEKVVAAHGASYAFLADIQRVFHALASELTQHMAKEETILFPMISQLEQAQRSGVPAPPTHCHTVLTPIQVMEHEHDDAGAALRKIRELTSDFTLPAGACNTFRALYAQLEELERDLHTHIHLENNVLFPRASALE